MHSNQIKYIISYGLSYTKTQNYHRALEIFIDGLKIEPNNLTLLYNIARTYLELKEFTKAMFFYNKLLFLKPDFIQANFDKAITLLLQNNFIDGFKEYESRLNFTQFHKPFPLQYPNNLEDLKNKKILVFHEQGFGDTINFISYVKEISKYSNKIEILVQSPLKKLLQVSFKKYTIVDKVINNKYDFVIPMLSIPYIFRFSTFIPQKRYLKVKNKELNDFILTNKIDKEYLNIGICWQGTMKNTRDKYRSIDIKNLESFLSLSTKHKVKFYSLQKEIRVNDSRIIDIANVFQSFYDSALAIKSLDLVISVDTSIVHLAGALGVKTFLLLPYLPDYRWGVHSKKSLFYKSVKIFRQEERGDWQKPIDLIKKELYKKLNIKNIMLFRSYSGTEENPMMIRIGDFMAYMILAQYYKTIKNRYLVLSLTSPLPNNFKADILFNNIFDEIYINQKQLHITKNIYDPDKDGGLWNKTPLLVQKYGNKILPKVKMKRSLCSETFTKEKDYIIFNPLVSASYNLPRNMAEEFINNFANQLQKIYKDKLIIITDNDKLIRNQDIKTILSDNLYDIFYLIYKSKIFIGGDTGFSHFAGIAKVPFIFSLYGTKYPSYHDNKYFNANVIYNTKNTKVYSYILNNNSLDNKSINQVLFRIKKALG